MPHRKEILYIKNVINAQRKHSDYVEKLTVHVTADFFLKKYVILGTRKWSQRNG